MSNEYLYASMRDSFDLSAYFVVGPEDCKGRPLTDVVDQALRGGATFIQLRAKEADASELTDMARDFKAYNAVWAEHFPDAANAPCRTTLGITALPTPIAIELKCVAVLKD